MKKLVAITGFSLIIILSSTFHFVELAAEPQPFYNDPDLGDLD
ncbi:hypothetical protein [Virgibacillus sp. JSM 102003]